MAGFQVSAEAGRANWFESNWLRTKKPKPRYPSSGSPAVRASRDRSNVSVTHRFLRRGEILTMRRAVLARCAARAIVPPVGNFQRITRRVITIAAKHLSGDLHFRIDQPDRTLRRTLHTSPRRIPFESSHCGIRRSNNRVSGPMLATGDACVTENVAQRWVRWNAFLYHSYNFSKAAPSTAPHSLTSPARRVAA